MSIIDDKTMRKKFEDTVENQMQKRLAQLSTNVVLWQDFVDLAMPRQLSRGFNKLLAKGILLKMGRGIYTKTKISQFSNKPIPVDFADHLLRDALDRLNVRWQPSSVEAAYNRGDSTQIPVTALVRLKSRLRRQLAINNYSLSFEGNINAR